MRYLLHLMLGTLFLFSLLILSADQVYGQQREVEGIVRSDEGRTLPGVNILIKGTDRGIATNADGEFSVNAMDSDTLVFSYIGYDTREIVVGEQSYIEVIMSPERASLDEVSVVGFGTETRITNTGAVSSVSASDIRTVPTPNVQNALTGKLPGFFSQQRSGQPGRAAADFYIRGVSSLNSEGNAPLIIVDDIEYSLEQLQQLDVNMIESISILKDASSTAVYGIKGANGVVVIETRRGSEGFPQVNVTFESGVQAPTHEPTFLNSYNTALLVNEALQNDGLKPEFSEEDLQLFQSGNDPYGHPDINWYEAIFRDYATQADIGVDVSGGTDKLRYFIAGGAFTQSGLVKDFSDPNNEVNTNYFYRRFNFRSNLDFDATENLSLRFDLDTRFNNINQPYSMNAVSEISNFEKIRPYSAPLYNPNGSYAYAYDTVDKLPTINARLANSGYQRTRRTDTNILVEAEQDMRAITEGLVLTGKLAYAAVDENYRALTRSLFGEALPPSYYFNPVDNSYTLDPRGEYTLNPYDNFGNTTLYRKKLDLQAHLNYTRTFNEDHNISALLLYNRQSTTNEPEIPYNFRGVTMKVGYDYKEKYMIDFNGAYNGTDRFGEGNRIGFFPAVSVGWSISQEPFFQNAFPFIQLFKLRASYGSLGSDQTPGNRYLYEQHYFTGGGYNFGENPEDYQSVYEGPLGNRDVTWEKIRKFDVGLDVNMFNNNLSLTVDYFYDYRYDQLITRGSIPSLIGVGGARYNIGETSNRGVDGEITYSNNSGYFSFNTSLIFSYAKNRIEFVDEPTPAEPWLSQIGLPLGQPFGYVFNGFYREEDIALNNDDNPDNDVPVPYTESPVQPGDLKYKDLNGNGIIEDHDQRPIGKPNLPTTTLGWSVGARYQGLSVNVLFQGAFDYSFSLTGTAIEPFQSQFQPIHQKRWTPENAEEASFPRLTSNPNTINSPNAYRSDFWLVDAWYVRLKTLDIGYQLPGSFLPGTVENIRLFLSGYNLFTWTGYNKYQQDPEISSDTSGDAYFNQRVLNLGIQIGL